MANFIICLHAPHLMRHSFILRFISLSPIASTLAPPLYSNLRAISGANAHPLPLSLLSGDRHTSDYFSA